MQPEGRTFLVTGASGGIGAATALALAERGARLLVHGRSELRMAALCRELPAGTRCVLADLTTEHGRADVIDAAAALPSGLDGVVMAAGMNALGLFAETPESVLRTATELNLFAPMALSRALLPLLAPRPEASLLLLGSVYGHIGHPGYALYSATKAGLRGFAQALGRELADSPVRVQHLAPRATATAMNHGAGDALNEALGARVDRPQAVAAAILSMIESGRREAVLGGPERFFVRLNALLPSVVDGSLQRQLATIRRHAGAARSTLVEESS